jgi:tyrosyl-tRNA synthetase
MKNFVNRLRERDMLYQEANICVVPKGVYCGFDATATSLQIGNLFPIALLRLASLHDVNTIALLGGATTQIGDPTGKNETRKELQGGAIQSNLSGIEYQLKSLLPNATLVNNAQWLNELTFMQFLDNIARHVSVGSLLKLEMFEKRLQNNDPLKLKELMYPMMQAYDFLWLYENANCNMQCGGADQWCNILAGFDIIKAKHKNAEVAAFTATLLTNKNGEKLGKSLKGAIYLDSSLTSTYDFWQFWRNISDEHVIPCLKRLTLLPIEEIEKSMNDINHAKIILANDITTWVHGETAAKQAQTMAKNVFVEKNLNEAQTIECTSNKLTEIVAAATRYSLSKARDLIEQGGIKINGEKIIDKNHVTTLQTFSLSVGKKHHFHIIIV